jgi:MarR family transcriptional regulator, organic hydroperoxide resistance regulator
LNYQLSLKGVFRGDALNKAVRRRPAIDGISASGQRTATASRAPLQNDSFEDFLWNVRSINSQFEAINAAWAQLLGVNVHQWMILLAIRSLSRGKGISVRGAADKLGMDPSVVTSQSKKLEKLGFLRRSSSKEDARVVLMSLTAKATREIDKLLSKHDAAKRSMFCELGDQNLDDINEKLALLRERLERTAKRLAAEL